MNKQEFLEQVKKNYLPLAPHGLITFRTLRIDRDDTIFFQYAFDSGIPLKEFVDYNFDFYGIKSVSKIDITNFNCLIVYVE